jgi:hypothetical protein
LPASPLDVVGNGTIGFQLMSLRNTNASGWTEFNLLDNNGVVGGVFGWGNSSTVALTNSLYFKSFRSGSYAPILFTQDNGTAINYSMSISSQRNVLIGTTTDAGFRLDVNGTARVQGNLTTSAGIQNFSNYQGYGQMQLFSGNAFQMFNSANNSKASFQYTTATGLSLSINPENLSGILNGLAIGPSLVASANNDVLVGLDINPTYSLGAFTSTTRIGARIQNSRFLVTGTYTSLSSEAANPDSLVQIDSTINGRGGSRAIAFRINPTINVNNVGNQVFAALEVTPTYQNVGAGSSALAINSSGPNRLGSVNTLGSQTTFSGQGGSSTFQSFTSIPNGQGLRVQVNSNIAGYSYEFDGSGIPTYTLRNNNIDALKVFSTGNVGINTTTDAGFKLDVNGSFRALASPNVGIYVNSTATFVNRTTLVVGAGDGTSISQGLQISANTGSGKTYINGWNDGGTNQYDIIIGNGGSRTQFGTDSTSIASAQVAINTTTRGFLPPRMTQTQRNAIASPAIGLEIYQTDATEGKYIFKSSGWTYIG